MGSSMAGAFLGGSAVVMGVLALVLLVLVVVARWKIFSKAGEAGWKSIIPIYSDYVQWRIGWKKAFLFWVTMALVVVTCLCMTFAGVKPSGSASIAPNMALLGLSAVTMIVAVILNVMAAYKLIRSFDMSGLWIVAYLFVPFILLLVMAFGSSEYVGAQD